MYYTIYKITNKTNGKIYIGSHKTKCLDDGYMGSGKYLKHAQKKYGIDAFHKEIMFVFDNPDEMYAKEAEIVNEDFLAEENTYNIKLGGFGGFDHLNSWTENPTHTLEHMKMMSSHRTQEMQMKAVTAAQKRYSEMLAENGGKQWFVPSRGFAGKQHTPETKCKISASTKGKADGEKNSQFGTMWITNGIENKKIKISSQIPEGWVKGRKMRL